MMAYHWPGNIRELEHLVERSVLLAKGTTIEDIPIPATARSGPGSTPPGPGGPQSSGPGAHPSGPGDTPSGPDTGDTPLKTMHENERDYIITVLKRCKGRIWGPGGAAEILNLPPTTLKSKMKKLGIRKEYME
jgi:DNA-binding NtrC family response regulator